VKLYDELASWWPLLSSPADYEEEAAFYAKALSSACSHSLRTLLEPGSHEVFVATRSVR
jgi:hypothetical protein